MCLRGDSLLRLAYAPAVQWALLEGVPAEEVRQAKEHIKGRTLLRMEDSYANASWFGVQEVLKDEALSVDEIVQQIEAVTPEEIQSLAQQLFLDPLLNLAVVGPLHNEDALQAALAI